MVALLTNPRSTSLLTPPPTSTQVCPPACEVSVRRDRREPPTASNRLKMCASCGVQRESVGHVGNLPTHKIGRCRSAHSAARKITHGPLRHLAIGGPDETAPSTANQRRSTASIVAGLLRDKLGEPCRGVRLPRALGRHTCRKQCWLRNRLSVARWSRPTTPC